MLLCSYEANRDQYTLKSVKRILLCPEVPSYLNKLLPWKRTPREKSVLVVRKVVSCILIKMIANSISCLYCLDVSGIFYIVYIVCMRGSLKSDLIMDAFLEVLIVNIPVGDNI